MNEEVMKVEKPLHVRVAERIKARVLIVESGCWEWQGLRDRKGYGRFSLGNRPTIVARASYAAFVGPIPQGLTIDHLCRNPPCVNPKHLEVVTRGQNTLRGNTITGRNARAVVCPKGHPYDTVNTYVDRRGRRACKACRREAKRSSEARARAAAYMRAQRAARKPTDDQRRAKAAYDRKRFAAGTRPGMTLMTLQEFCLGWTALMLLGTLVVSIMRWRENVRYDAAMEVFRRRYPLACLCGQRWTRDQELEFKTHLDHCARMNGLQ